MNTAFLVNRRALLVARSKTPAVPPRRRPAAHQRIRDSSQALDFLARTLSPDAIDAGSSKSTANSVIVNSSTASRAAPKSPQQSPRGSTVREESENRSIERRDRVTDAIAKGVVVLSESARRVNSDLSNSARSSPRGSVSRVNSGEAVPVHSVERSRSQNKIPQRRLLSVASSVPLPPESPLSAASVEYPQTPRTRLCANNPSRESSADTIPAGTRRKQRERQEEYKERDGSRLERSFLRLPQSASASAGPSQRVNSAVEVHTSDSEAEGELASDLDVFASPEPPTPAPLRGSKGLLVSSRAQTRYLRQSRLFTERLSYHVRLWTPVKTLGDQPEPHWVIAIDYNVLRANRASNDEPPFRPTECYAFRKLFRHIQISIWIVGHFNSATRARAEDDRRFLCNFLGISCAHKTQPCSLKDGIFLHALDGPEFAAAVRNTGRAQALHRFRTNVLISDRYSDIRECNSAGFLTYQFRTYTNQPVYNYPALKGVSSTASAAHVSGSLNTIAEAIVEGVDSGHLGNEATLVWGKKSWSIAEEVDRQRSHVPALSRASHR